MTQQVWRSVRVVLNNRRQLAVGLFAAMLVVGAVSAQATGSGHWKLSSLPSSHGESINGVSCASRSCIAVGGSSTSVLAARLRGGHWSPMSPPDPPPGPKSFTTPAFFAVSCSSTKACSAVGVNSCDAAIAEGWNGQTWAVQPGAPVDGAGCHLAGVVSAISCPSNKFCLAVGGSGPGIGRAVVDRWNGVKWSSLRFPLGSSELNGVWCFSARACAAVGDEKKGAMAGWWNGHRWRLQRLGRSAQRKTFSLRAVSCLSKRNCIAVGDNDFGGIAARWNGNQWSLTKGNLDLQETGVACTSILGCVAVGEDGTKVRVWSASKWLVRSTGIPGKLESQFAGVSCVAARCLAVGSDVKGVDINHPIAATNF